MQLLFKVVNAAHETKKRELLILSYCCYNLQPAQMQVIWAEVNSYSSTMCSTFRCQFKFNISVRIFTWFFYCKSNLVLPTKHAGTFLKSLLTFRILAQNLIQASMSHETTDINKTQCEVLLFPLPHLWNTDTIILYRLINQQSIYLLIFKYVFIWLTRLFSRLIVPAFCPEWLLNMNNLTNCLFIVQKKQ